MVVMVVVVVPVSDVLSVRGRLRANLSFLARLSRKQCRAMSVSMKGAVSARKSGAITRGGWMVG